MPRPLRTDFIQLARYVERNPLRANIVKKAQKWHWSSLWIREQGSNELKKLLSPWPIHPNKDYSKLINKTQDKEEEKEIVKSIIKSRPLGKEPWVKTIAKRLGLESSLKNPGRPKKNGS